jgi:hypothetical protein
MELYEPQIRELGNLPSPDYESTTVHFHFTYLVSSSRICHQVQVLTY